MNPITTLTSPPSFSSLYINSPPHLISSHHRNRHPQKQRIGKKIFSKGFVRDCVCEKMMDTRDQYGNRVEQVDAYGNPIQQVDAYGNPTTGTGHETGYGHGTAGHGTTGTGGQAQMMRPGKEQRSGGILHRSGSSSSSSSEEDGMGGRRKKGLKEKVKEKLPGGHKTDEYGQAQATTGGYGTTTGTTGYGGTAGRHEPEKKGMVEKIKEKLPGHH